MLFLALLKTGAARASQLVLRASRVVHVCVARIIAIAPVEKLLMRAPSVALFPTHGLLPRWMVNRFRVLWMVWLNWLMMKTPRPC